MFAQETGEVFLMCLTLSHPDLATPIRVVHNNENITRTAGVHYASFFEMNLPEEVAGSIPQVTLAIENVDRSITDSIRLLSGRVAVTMDVVLASSPNVVEAGPFNFSLLSASFNVQSVQGRLGFEDDVLNQGFPADTFTPVNSSGLFK